MCICTKLFAVHEDERPKINEEWPASIKGMLECSFEKDITLRLSASLLYDIIRDELKNLRKGNARGLSDTWLQCRRTYVSFNDGEVDDSFLHLNEE